MGRDRALDRALPTRTGRAGVGASSAGDEVPAETVELAAVLDDVVATEIGRWIGDADPAVCSAIAAILEQQREHVGEVAERLGCAGA